MKNIFKLSQKRRTRLSVTVLPTAAALLAALLLSSGCTDGNTPPSEVPDTPVSVPAVSPEDADGMFTIAVFPDTQQLVTVEEAIDGEYFSNATAWLADNKEELDLRLVAHTGDIVNWGNEEPRQFKIASWAFDELDSAEVPVALCLGNHDTAAVGVGGSAKDPMNTRTRVRDTASFNEYFSVERYDEAIPFEDGKIDNAYQLFSAGGKKWMMLTLELWPREEVVDWAARMIENHPKHNVMIATHSYLTHKGDIYQGSDYGEKSPQYLYDNLISKYENVRMVFCGHTGSSFVREDTGEHGNKILTLLGCFHSSTQNPIRLLEIDAAFGEVSGRVYSPIDDTEWTQYDFEVEDMDFIEP